MQMQCHKLLSSMCNLQRNILKQLLKRPFCLTETIDEITYLE